MVISTSYWSRGHLEKLNLELLLSILLCQLRIKILINYVLMISFRSIPFTSFLHNLPLFFSHENVRKNYSCYYHKKNLLNYPWRSLTNRNCSRPKLITELFSSSNSNILHFTSFLIQWSWPTCVSCCRDIVRLKQTFMKGFDLLNRKNLVRWKYSFMVGCLGSFNCHRQYKNFRRLL